MVANSTASLELYLSPAEYVDSDHPAVVAFAKEYAGKGGAKSKAKALYRAVRDGVRYKPYQLFSSLETYRASSVLAAGHGYCVGKASLYAAACRAAGLPARVGFSDVRNHLATPRLLEAVGTDLFMWHAYTEVMIGSRWVKATPTFNASLCEKMNVAPLDFDGVSDALLQAFDAGGRVFMDYTAQHGTFFDVPAKFLVRMFAAHYPRLTEVFVQGGDMEKEAEALRAG
jgi:transglutaminase-like putative cysteine protease